MTVLAPFTLNTKKIYNAALHEKLLHEQQANEGSNPLKQSIEHDSFSANIQNTGLSLLPNIYHVNTPPVTQRQLPWVRFGYLLGAVDREHAPVVLGDPTNRENSEHEVLYHFAKALWAEAVKPREGLPQGYLQPETMIYKILPFYQLAKIAARYGYSERFHHWRWGQETDQIFSSEDKNLSRIFEMYVVGNPSVAYLQDRNSVTMQKLVMSHVMGHSDFANKNMMLKAMDRGMMYKFRAHRQRINQLSTDPKILKTNPNPNENPIELFLDKLFSIENLIDYSHNPAEGTSPPLKFSRRGEVEDVDLSQAGPQGDESLRAVIFGDAIQHKLEKDIFKRRLEDSQKLPFHPTRDVMGFILEHSHTLEPWQKEVMQMFREEAYYLIPIMKTKIMNEGWAVFWQHRFLLASPELHPAVNWVEANQGCVMNMEGANPYNVGYRIWQRIYEKAGRGLLDMDWTDVSQIKKRELWKQPIDDAKAIQVMQDIRAHMTDVDFARRYVDTESLQKMGFLPEDKPPESLGHETQELKAQLLDWLVNSGGPVIEVENGNYHDQGELYLHHIDDNKHFLDRDFAEKTMKIIFSLWGKPVHLQTYDDKGNEIVLKCSGDKPGTEIYERPYSPSVSKGRS